LLLFFYAFLVGVPGMVLTNFQFCQCVGHLQENCLGMEEVLMQICKLLIFLVNLFT